MPERNMIKIDDEKCNGCGQCIVDCAEGALAIIDGKAKLVKESYCDGLGACIGNCPTGALTIEKREAPAFDFQEDAVHTPAPTKPAPAPGGACPGSRSFQFKESAAPVQASSPCTAPPASALTHWPIQLHLVNFQSPQYKGQDILIAADCSAFSCGSFHPHLLQGKALAIACPKLDDTHGYQEKLTDLFQNSQASSVTVVSMEVPCCRGITQWTLSARTAAESTIPIEEIVLGVDGTIKTKRMY